MPFQAVSLGREVDVWTPRAGSVHSAFDHAVNLRVDGEMWTVLGAAATDSPFGIRLAASDIGIGIGIKMADRVSVRAGYVGVGRLLLDCRTATRWSPTRWPRPATGLAGRVAAVEQAARPRAWTESAAMATSVINALCGSDADLSWTVRQTVGRGPGLTPAGDDVLVGILALLTSGAAGAEGDYAASRLVRALTPALPTTSDISRHLLFQAMRGLPGRALHDLGRAVVAGVPQEALEDAIARVLSVGCTSGADACMGLVNACRFTFSHIEKGAV